MKKLIALLLAFSLVLLCGCDGLTEFLSNSSQDSEITEPDETKDITPPEPEPPVPEPPAPDPPDPEPLHSDLYIPGFTADDVIRYFNEVCLDAEFSTGPGDASLLQKWDGPIDYFIHGNPTQKDLEVLDDFICWLNTIEGFPGMLKATHAEYATLQIYFCTEQELIDRMGSNFYNTDGAVTFWYNGNDEIYRSIICYRTDIAQYVRNSVILEEIYNGLGPVQDTDLRTDSIIYSGYSTPQQLTAIDELLLKLLYHPALSCGMNAEQCAEVIRTLYY